MNAEDIKTIVENLLPGERLRIITDLVYNGTSATFTIDREDLTITNSCVVRIDGRDKCAPFADYGGIIYLDVKSIKMIINVIR